MQATGAGCLQRSSTPLSGRLPRRKVTRTQRQTGVLQRTLPWIRGRRSLWMTSSRTSNEVLKRSPGSFSSKR